MSAFTDRFRSRATDWNQPTFRSGVRPCKSTVIAYLGFGPKGTTIPCVLLLGHTGPHRYTIEWTDPPADTEESDRG